MRANQWKIEWASAKRVKDSVGMVRGQIKLFVGQVPNAWGELEPQQVHQGKDMIGETCGVCVVFFDTKLALVFEQFIENIATSVPLGASRPGRLC